MKPVLFFISTFIFCSAVFCQNDEKANVLAVERSIADALTKHNLIYINTIFSDDAVIISPKAEVITKQQFAQTVSNITGVTVSDMQVKVKGTIAIVVGVETETGKNDAGGYSNKYRFTDVLEKIKGQWQVISSQATSIDQQ